jgi:hypothetical protein
MIVLYFVYIVTLNVYQTLALLYMNSEHNMGNDLLRTGNCILKYL